MQSNLTERDRTSAEQDGTGQVPDKCTVANAILGEGLLLGVYALDAFLLVYYVFTTF